MTTIKTTKNICSKIEKINIKEDVVIPPTKLPIDEIISIEPTLLNTEAVPSQDSVKISGDITASTKVLCRRYLILIFPLTV